MQKPEALWFGREQSRCFGMLHRPEQPSSRGVIFCNTLGFDGELAYRAFRHLADNVTRRGQWSLRFDYDGERDSAGGPWEPGRLDAWLASIDDAVAVMHRRGVTEVRVVGFRMGATLAYLHATTHAGISGAVLWSPCIRGKGFVRELRALSRLSAAARPPQRVAAHVLPDDALEVVGFEFAGETLSDLAAIDLLAAPHAVLPSVLVIDRDDAPASDDLVDKLVESGAHVDHEQIPGYAEFVVDDEVKSVLPWSILHRIEDWLEATPACVPPATSGPSPRALCESANLSIDVPTAAPLAPLRGRVIEEPVWVDDRLFAVASRPAAEAPDRRACIVLANTGSAPRIGPGRLHVNLARDWASRGFTVLRVDLGGSGDSIGADPLTENQPHAPARVEELRDTVVWARRWSGNERVNVCGLCSGAFNAFHVAADGLDVDHLMIVNPGIFYLGADLNPANSDEHTLNMAYTFTRSLTNPRRWKLALQDPKDLARSMRNARRMIRTGATSGLRSLVAISAQNARRKMRLPVKTTALARDLEEMIGRGVKVFMVFAAGESAANYLRACGRYDALLKSGGLEVLQLDGGDHLFSPPDSRRWFTEVTTSYLERGYPPLLEPLITDGRQQTTDSADS